MNEIRILYVAEEAWPTHRSDIAVLFGKYLPRYRIRSDMVTDSGPGPKGTVPAWRGGSMVLCSINGGAIARHAFKFWHNVSVLLRCKKAHYDAIQVRDMPVTAFVALVIARAKGIPFFYWMSFPQSEGQIVRAKARGARAGFRYWFPLVQGTIGKWLLYRIVLGHADHVFAQSDQMVRDLADRGVDVSRMTAVPMGVDLEVTRPQFIASSQDRRLEGKSVIVYLGTLDRTRSIDMLFHMLAIVLAELPDVVLVLAGDTEDADYRDWLKQEASRLGVMESTVWTGWLPTQEAWQYVRAARVGLSPFPRGYLLDSASPTKAMEYMALGIPVIVNDNPDQKHVVEQANSGLCVELSAAAFAQAVITLLRDPVRCKEMGAAGERYIRENRGYGRLAGHVATSYRSLLRRDQQPEAA
jgi:glycosyltransferase involved in cell wall biosynthesis